MPLNKETKPNHTFYSKAYSMYISKEYRRLHYIPAQSVWAVESTGVCVCGGGVDSLNKCPGYDT